VPFQAAGRTSTVAAVLDGLSAVMGALGFSRTKGRPAAGATAAGLSWSTGYRQAGCWQSHRSSILSPACLQCSLQYFP
jgi:hypothetical protein